MDWSVIWQYRAAILQGLWYTVAISALAIVGSLILGTLFGCVRAARVAFLEELIDGYVEIVRNIPVIVKVFFLYFVVGMNAWPSGVLALIIHQTAYIADVLAAGFRSIHPEQAESGYAQGLTRRQTFIFCLLPQAVRISLPPLTSQFIEVVKNSTVIMFVGVQELTFETQEISQTTFRSFEVAAVATALYVMLSLVIAGGMSRLGRRLTWA